MALRVLPEAEAALLHSSGMSPMRPRPASSFRCFLRESIGFAQYLEIGILAHIQALIGSKVFQFPFLRKPELKSLKSFEASEGWLAECLDCCRRREQRS